MTRRLRVSPPAGFLASLGLAVGDESSGQGSDYGGYTPLMAANGPPPRMPLADQGYDSDAIRQDMEASGGVAVMPARRTRRGRDTVDAHIYAPRNRIERCFNRLKNACRLSSRYDKTADSYLGFAQIALIRLWIRNFVNTP